MELLIPFSVNNSHFDIGFTVECMFNYFLVVRLILFFEHLIEMKNSHYIMYFLSSFLQLVCVVCMCVYRWNLLWKSNRCCACD